MTYTAGREGVMRNSGIYSIRRGYSKGYTILYGRKAKYVSSCSGEGKRYPQYGSDSGTDEYDKGGCQDLESLRDLPSIPAHDR